MSSLIDIRELLEYNKNVRHRYFEIFTKMSWEDFTKNREASFHSIRNIFVHTLNAIDFWLDFLQKKSLHSKKRFREYETLDEVRTYLQHVEKRMQDYLDLLSIDELDRKYIVTNDDDKNIEVTAEDVLIHVFEEEVHHRGEIIALLWQIGIEPPLMGWKEL